MLATVVADLVHHYRRTCRQQLRLKDEGLEVGMYELNWRYGE